MSFNIFTHMKLLESLKLTRCSRYCLSKRDPGLADVSSHSLKQWSSAAIWDRADGLNVAESESSPRSVKDRKAEPKHWQRGAERHVVTGLHRPRPLHTLVGFAPELCDARRKGT